MTPSDAIWSLPIEQAHNVSASAGPLSFVGGAADLGANGVVRHRGDLRRQIAGALDALAAALAPEGCTLDDVVRLKAFYTAPEGNDEWRVIGDLAKGFAKDPMPAISLVPVPMQPFAGQRVQLQAIAQRGWRELSDVRVAVRPVPKRHAKLFGGRPVTGGLRAGEFIAVANRAAADGEGSIAAPNDPVAQSHAIMATHEATLGALGASLQDAIKMEGYYFGTTREHWAPLAKARASHFREPGPVATVVPCHRLHPKGALTKIEVMAMRESWNRFDKYIPREDHWPRRVWDWPIPLPYRQAIRLRDMIWLGGQVPSEPDSNKGRRVLPGQLLPQTRFTMSLIEDLLRGFGRRPSDLKLIVAYFTSKGTPEETRAFLATIAACAGGVLPPITAVPQPHMHDPATTVEIWGIARG
ncbi:MAG: Rid family hydrolase [Alphaproteobacteria bacterium]